MTGVPRALPHHIPSRARWRYPVFSALWHDAERTVADVPSARLTSPCEEARRAGGTGEHRRREAEWQRSARRFVNMRLSTATAP